MRKVLFRLCSMLVVITLLTNMLPMSVFAEEFQEVLANTETVTKEETISADTYVVDEIVDKRTEFSKEFLLSNGLHMATVYANAVHYETENGWEEIDNTLKTNADGSISNTAGVWDVTFPQELTEDESITIEKDGYTLSFFMAGELNSSSDAMVMSANQVAAPMVIKNAHLATAQIQTPDLTATREAAEFEETVLEKTQSRLTYANVYENTNVVYDLDSNQVKESVILERHNDTLRGYQYTLEVGDMIPVLAEDGQITFYDEKQKDVVVVMPAPFLVDDAGERSDDIQVLLEGGNGSYTMSYLLPQAWLASPTRAWPVVLDPAVQPVMITSNIRDKTVTSKNQSSHSNIWYINGCGCSDHAGTMRTYLKYRELPKLTSSDVIVGAVVRMCKYPGIGYSTTVEVHKVTGEWESETLTWSDQDGSVGDPVSINPIVEDYAVVDECEQPTQYCWTVTDIVRDWYAGSNTGMAFKLSNELDTALFFSSDFREADAYQPTLTIYFRNNNGLESYWDYTSASAGRAGTGYVNNFTGNMVWVRNDIGFGGNRMPVSIQHIYNLNDATVPTDSNNANDSANTFGMGIGWRTNYNQLVYEWKINEISQNYYIWEDEDGTDHYFRFKDGKYRHEDDDELILTVDGIDDITYEVNNTTYTIENIKYRIEDKNGNSKYFDSDGYLIAMSNYQKKNSYITITYAGSVVAKNKRIDYIMDGVRRKYDFHYNIDPGNSYSENDAILLDSIIYTGTGTSEYSYCVSFEYTNGCLFLVTDPDGQSSTYTYNGFVLTKAKDVDNYRVEYSYVTPDTIYKPYRTQRVSEFDGDTEGGYLEFDYAHNQTTITDHNYNTQILQFNDFGNTICIQDDEGRAQFYKYALNTDNDVENNTDPSKRKNQLRVNSDLQYSVNNLFKRNNLRTTAEWSVFGGRTSVEVASSPYVADTKSLEVRIEDEHLSGEFIGTLRGVQSQSYSLPAGKTFTFSCYVRAMIDDDVNVFLKASGPDGDAVSTSSMSYSSHWQRLQVSYTNKTGTTQSVQFYVLTQVGEHGFYMDCPQLELCETASRYNLINNGDFSYNYSDVWTGRDDVFDTVVAEEQSPAPQLNNLAFQFQADPERSKSIKQRVYLDGKAGDNLTLCGWAKGNAVPLTDYNLGASTREFAIRAQIIYRDLTRSDYFTAQFNPDVNQWQYTATGIIAEKDFWLIDVELVCNYLANTISFDGIQLYRDEFGSSYEYDDEGNVVAISDSSGKKSSYEYTDNNLTKEILHTGSELTYEYDDFHNVTKATTEEGLIYEFRYDDWGNNTSVSISDGTNTMVSTAVYSIENTEYENGNRLVCTTDAQGKTTNYGYNADTNVLEWVQYPKDTEATRTNYVYDAMYRMNQATSKTDTGLELSVSYNYPNDLLNSITTPSTAYGFTYGDFGLRQTVTAGNKTLAKYYYEDNANKYLKRLEYGNDDSIEYTYDNKGRVIEQYYENNEYVEYTYGNDGKLATVFDFATGITTTYGYNYAGQLARYEERGTDYSYVLAYAYDSKEQLKTIRESVNGHDRYSTITYDEDNRVESFEKVHAKREYTYDKFDRVSSAKTTDKDTTEVFTTSYTFGTNRIQTNNQVTEMRNATPATEAGTNYDVTYSYKYDDNGNITEVQRRGKSNTLLDKTTYYYDSANQLIREDYMAVALTDNPADDSTENPTENLTEAPTDDSTDSPSADPVKSYIKIWTYDNAGNILTRTKYAYTDEEELGMPTETVSYGYDTTSGWGDLLDSYNGNTIASDAIGNITDDGTWEYGWKHGRELASMSKKDSEEIWIYTYNANGMRTSRSNGTTTYKYVYNGSELDCMFIQQGSITTRTNFTHAPDGTPMGFVVGSTTYYYVTNLQGDVVALLDPNGNTVVEYTYDAWGNPLETKIPYDESHPKYNDYKFVADNNPLRYRGYVYDSETGFYYLQSRYYDPEVGRFINADGLISTGQGLSSNNMFAYCGNNPVIRVDRTGYCYYAGGVWTHDAWENLGGYEKKPDPGTYEEISVINGDAVTTYKGVPVVQTSWMENSGFSFGVVLLGDDIIADNAGVQLVRHEYGHTKQLQELGIIGYTGFVMLPSIICYHLDNAGELGVYYYSLPWEFEADIYGKVSGRKGYSAQTSQAYYVYKAFTYILRGQDIPMEIACKINS